MVRELDRSSRRIRGLSERIAQLQASRVLTPGMQVELELLIKRLKH